MNEEELHYRQVIGGLLDTRADLRAAKRWPEVIVKLQVDENDVKIIKELLGTPALEFRVVAVDSPDGTRIALHIRLKHKENDVPEATPRP